MSERAFGRRGGRRLLAAALAACALVACAFAAAPSPAGAQALWLDRARPHNVMLEVLFPEPAGSDDVTDWSGVVFLTGRTEFSPTLHGVGELSLATASLHGGLGFDEDTGAILGSPYLGIELGRADALALFEAGVRIPIDDSKFVTTNLALGSDLERQSAWFDDDITTRLGVRVRSRPTEGLGIWVEGRLAPEFVIPLDLTDVEVHATYGATARITRSWVRGGIGIGGRAVFEPDDDDDSIEAAHVVEVAADFGSGALRPGLSLRLPFDGNFGEAFDRTLGLQLTYLP